VDRLVAEEAPEPAVGLAQRFATVPLEERGARHFPGTAYTGVRSASASVQGRREDKLAERASHTAAAAGPVHTLGRTLERMEPAWDTGQPPGNIAGDTAEDT